MSGPGLQALGLQDAGISDKSSPSPIEPWIRPLRRFLSVESASGILLLASTLVALGLANSPWAEEFDHLFLITLGVQLGDFVWAKPLHFWINDGLMTIFFFVAGLEIKREWTAGELRDLRKAAIPVMAALGGMIAPAIIYLVLQPGGPGKNGWGIPMATDIAFVVGFLALLGKRVPVGLKILLLSLAIADDIGAVVVIAVFYSTNISLVFLAAAGAGLILVILLRWLGIRRMSIYVALGAAVWLAALHSGIHPTVAGVLLGLLTPASPLIDDQRLTEMVTGLSHRLANSTNGDLKEHDKTAHADLEMAACESISPLERLEATLHPWVAFGIMPVFAFANAGVTLNFAAFADPIAWAVALALLMGKPVGILTFSWLTVIAKFGRLPSGVNWKVMLSAGCLGGIGFTMSLFIAGLALDGEHLDAAKVGILAGSATSACVGSVLLLLFLPAHQASAVKPRSSHRHE